jgi:glycosyltransferase involved in cell wall biosynthesis
VPHYAYNLLKQLFKIDSENKYFLFFNKFGGSSKVLKEFPQIKELINKENVKLIGFGFPNKLLNFSLRFLKYPKLDKLIEKKINSKVDIWFSPNPGFVNLSNDCKFILTIHDLSFERYPEFFAGKGNLGIGYIRGRFWHKYVGVKKLCCQADKIIAVSESTSADLEDVYGIECRKIKVVYEGTNMNQESRIKNQESVRQKYDLPEKFILFLGTLEPRKNIAAIIQAFEVLNTKYQIQNTNLVITGKKGWLYDDLFKLAENVGAGHCPGLKDKIKFIGYVDEADKSALYNLASLFVFPSFYEGFGLPPLEAMSCGCPVIASTAFALSEVVGDAGILVDPYNINDLAEAMKLVLNNEELKNRLIQKGIKRAKLFNWERAAQESLKVLKN